MSVLILKPKTVTPLNPNIDLAIKQHPECQKLLEQGYKLEATHEYTDKNGASLFYRVRLKNTDSNEKWTRPVYFNGTQSVWKEPDFQDHLKPLYKLQDITLNPKARIWICEGEWAADHLNNFFLKQKVYGLNIATTSGASSSANKAYWKPLANHKIVIWPDNDDPGFKYAKDVSGNLSKLGCDIEMVDVKSLNLPEKGDALDWLEEHPQACFDDINSLPLIAPSVEVGVPERKPLIEYIVSAQELVEINLPELEHVVFPFIAEQSLAMVFAKRGAGKTWFSLQLAISVASGKPFFVWDVPKPRRVFFIDGEMPISALQFRIKNLYIDELPALLNILPSEYLWRNGQSLNLNEESDLDHIDNCLNDLKDSNQIPELIIIDNLSSLTAGVDENGNSEMDTMLRWLLKLRSQGYAVLVVHHAGKNGDQRGGSRREDFLDTSIKLTEVDRTIGDNEVGAKFNIEFVKLRGIRPAPDKLRVELTQNKFGDLVWNSEGAEILPAYYEALRIIRDCQPKSQAEIAKTLYISASAVSQQLKTARLKGLLEKGKLELTKKGKNEIDKVYTDYSSKL